jgi:hypothetical protein
MADLSSFFSALSAWRRTPGRLGALCASPWRRDDRAPRLARCFVLARLPGERQLTGEG